MMLDGQRHTGRRVSIERAVTEGMGTLLYDAEMEDARRVKFGEYRKRTTIYAVQMKESFQVHTIEGLHDGKAGDWLAVGIAGEMYPIDAEVFAATYEPVE